jgi:hypothetical protein
VPLRLRRRGCGGDRFTNSRFRNNRFRDSRFSSNRFRSSSFRSNRFRDNRFRDSRRLGILRGDRGELLGHRLVARRRGLVVRGNGSELHGLRLVARKAPRQRGTGRRLSSRCLVSRLVRFNLLGRAG